VRGVSRRSVSGIDALHSGMKSAARRSAFQVRLTRQFEWHGLKSAAEPGRPRARVEGALGPSCHFLVSPRMRGSARSEGLVSLLRKRARLRCRTTRLACGGYPAFHSASARSADSVVANRGISSFRAQKSWRY
jgi:hypothetical protein